MFKLFELCLVHCLLIQLYARFHFFFQDSVENMVESKEDMWCAFDVSLKFLVLAIQNSGPYRKDLQIFLETEIESFVIFQRSFDIVKF